MKERYCPACDHELKPADMNLAEGVALCPSCGALTRLANLVEHDPVIEGVAGIARKLGIELDGDLSPQIEGAWRNLPKGCEVTGWPGDVTLKASARSLSNAFGLLFFAVFWNSIVSIFVAVMLMGLYTNLIGPLPGNFMGSNQNQMPLGIALFLMVFLIPFVLVGAAVAGSALTAIMGDVQLQIKGDKAVASTGVGPLRWRRRFSALTVTNVTISRTTWKQNNRSQPVILIEAGKDVRIGSVLPKDRMLWLASAAHLMLLAPDTSQASELLSTGSPTGSQL